MFRNLRLIVRLRSAALGIAIVVSSPSVFAQFLQASPPIADPADARFEGTTEDWTTPALNTSHLRAVPPRFGYVADHPGYTVELLQLQWRWGDPLDLYVVKPKGIKKPPVILYLYGYPADTDIFKQEGFQKAVTQDGLAAVGFVSALTGHRYHDRPMREWFVSELQESLAASVHDVQMLLNYLATRDDLDMRHVGMFTQGSGATIGILAAAVDPRIQVLDALDPWGDWPTWMANSPFVPEEERTGYNKPEFLKKVAPLEPIEWLSRVQSKKFRLQQALFETDTPQAAKEKLRAAVPSGSTVAVYKTPQEFGAAFSQGKNLEWLRRELRSLPVGESGTVCGTPAKLQVSQLSRSR